MSFFDDYGQAIEDYPDTEVQIEIVDVDVPGSALNVGERGSFRVRITNRGALMMDDVTLDIRGLAGTKVKNNGIVSPLVEELVTERGQVGSVPARGGTQETGGSPLEFEAPGSPRPLQDLIEVTLAGWNAREDNLLTAHSRGSQRVRAVYRDSVRAA
jgi:hypothetical protein